jgi:acyl-CoA synthetase (AMP-forming)/AMP-acid ligase II
MAYFAVAGTGPDAIGSEQQARRACQCLFERGRPPALARQWQLPDRIEFIGAIPRLATGKFKKTELRGQFA